MQHDRFTFRGKALGSNRWIYGGAWHKGDQYLINGTFVDLATVGQCSGLGDRKGQMIFEGDIVLYCGKASYIVRYGIYNKHHELTNCAPAFVLGWYLEAIGEDYTCELYAIDGYAAMFPAHCAETEEGRKSLILEKVGNRWDNPELLEVGV